MLAVVFAGPSLARTDVKTTGVMIEPPAVAGDVYAAVANGAQVIGLIDAKFESEQTVRHDELLYALHAGVHVFGAASMGALRAVECESFGMRGHGRIYDLYHSQEIDGDHEVAVNFGPAELGWPSLSVPMVNVRSTLENAVRKGHLNDSETEVVLKVASSIYYKDLTWETIQVGLTNKSLRSKLALLIPECYVDQKARDAEALLGVLEEFVSHDVPPFVPPFDFKPTVFWDDFAEEQSHRTQKLPGNDRDVLDELRLEPVRYSELLLRAFARRAALVGDWDAELNGDLETFRTELGLVTGHSFREWLAENRTDEIEFSRFLNADTDLERALEEAAPGLERDILDELRAEDQFSLLDARATEKRSLVHDRSAAKMPQEFAGFDLKDLLVWFYRSRRVSADFNNPDEVARSLGLRDQKALHVLLRREFEYARKKDDQRKEGA